MGIREALRRIREAAARCKDECGGTHDRDGCRHEGLDEALTILREEGYPDEDDDEQQYDYDIA